MVPLGIAMAATVRVGYAAGARDAEGARRAGITALILSAGFMTVCSLVFALFPRAIVGLYLDLQVPENADAIAHAVSFLHIVAALQIVDGLQVVASFALRGLKDVRIPMFLAAISYWGAGFPLALIFAFWVGLEGVGVWMGLAAGLAFAALFLTTRFLYLSAVTTRPAR